MNVISATTRTPSPAEEQANAISAAVGAILATLGLIVLVAITWESGQFRFGVALIYGLSAVALFTASAAYHHWGGGPNREVLRRLDHAAIYVLIAGSYTPFTLITLPPVWGWTMFGLVWAMALVGIGCKTFWGVAHDGASTALYVVMGWMGGVAMVPLINNLDMIGVAFVVAGGAAYTGGVPFFVLDRAFDHLIWHLSVLVGASCHFAAVAMYVLPA